MNVVQEDLDSLVQWAKFRACTPCRVSEEPVHPGCETAFHVARMLTALKRFEGATVDGMPVAGWLLEEA